MFKKQIEAVQTKSTHIGTKDLVTKVQMAV